MFLDNPLFLKIEIISLVLFLSYSFYYIFDKIFKIYIRLKSIVSPKKKRDKKVEIKQVNISCDKKNHHFSSYKKSEIAWEKKQEISALLKKVKLYISKWEYDLAQNIIIEWLVIDKFNKDLNLELASICIIEKKYSKAEFIYKDLLLVHNNDSDILKKLWYILSMQEKYDLAIEMYKKALAKKSGDNEVVNMLAHLCFYKWLYSESINYFKIFLRQYPKDTENIYYLAKSYEKIHNYKDAILNLEKILALEPYNEDIKKDLEDLKSQDTKKES